MNHQNYDNLDTVGKDNVESIHNLLRLIQYPDRAGSAERPCSFGLTHQGDPVFV